MTSISLPSQCRVVVADGARALFLRNHGTAAEPTLVVEDTFEHADAPTREQGSAAPGRRAAPVGAARSAIEQTDFQELEEARFAARVADRLSREAMQDAYAHLVLVADPDTLGELRLQLHPRALDRVCAQLPKTLTRHATADIQRALTGQH